METLLSLATKIAEYVHSLFLEILRVQEWQWDHPAFFLALVLPVLAVWGLASSHRSRLRLTHAAGWLFEEPSRWRRMHGRLWRTMALVGLWAALSLGVLYLAHPYRESEIRIPENAGVQLHAVIDTSGSMGCLKLLKTYGFLEKMVAEMESRNAHVKAVGAGPISEVGYGWFSSTSPERVAPTTSAEFLLKNTDRYLGWCRKGGAVPPGTQQGTEPGPSMWEAVQEIAYRYDPLLYAELVEAFDREIAESANPQGDQLKRYSVDIPEHLRKAMCEATRGARILLVSDMDFSEVEGAISVKLVLNLAEKICLPVDAIAVLNEGISSLSADEAYGLRAISQDLNILLKKTGGERIRIEVANPRIFFEKARENAPEVRYIIVQDRNELPRMSLVLLALVALITWVVALRRVIIGW